MMTNIAASPPLPPGRYGLRQAVDAELCKVTTLRSSVWTLVVTVVGSLAVTALSANGVAHHGPRWYQDFDPTNQSLAGLLVATLTFGVFGVLVASGEFGTGTIRSSLAATPRRPLFLTAKALVVGALVLVGGEVITFACFGVGQGMLAAGGAPTATLGQPGVLRALLLSGAFLALLALLGFGLGVIFRHTAGALAAYAGVIFLVPLVLQRLPSDPSRFTPIPILANSVAAVVPQGKALAAPAGFGLMVLYSAAVIGLAAVLFVRRDA